MTDKTSEEKAPKSAPAKSNEELADELMSPLRDAMLAYFSGFASGMNAERMRALEEREEPE